MFMGSITVIYTKKLTSPISWLVRWALPRSRFKIAETSHGYIQSHDNPLKYYEATSFFGFKSLIEAIKTGDLKKMTGVREVDIKEVRKNTIVRIVSYEVPNVKEGMTWLEQQVGKGYDFKGAVGVSLSPTRDWNEEDCWFCYELIAGTLKNSGLNVFENLGHITETALFAIKSKILDQ